MSGVDEGVRPTRMRQANSLASGQEQISPSFSHAAHRGLRSSHFFRRRRQHEQPVLQRERRGLS